ncbi:response regulator transcription factor [Saccharomonospora xinjiangensis]|uniref:helix-turn-helix transcriptional regulator n=1 Tax=Saccharomonospora xinjiangensis TaxID=75294 RepID=UPI00350F00B1
MYLPLHTVRQLVSVVDTLAAEGDPDRFPESCLAMLCDLLAADSVVYQAEDLRTGKASRVEFHRPSSADADDSVEGACQGHGSQAHLATLAVEPFPGFRVTVVFARRAHPFTDVEQHVCELLGEPLASVLRRLHSGRLVTPDLRDGALTLREQEIVQLVALGRTNVAIGHELALSPRTVAKHLEHIYRKLRVGGRAEAVARALE